MGEPDVPFEDPEELRQRAFDEARELYADLKAEVDREYAERWEPTEQKYAIGRIVECSESIFTQHGPAAVITIESLNPEDPTRQAIWLVHSVLRNAFARQRPQRGDIIAVRHNGQIVPQVGNAYEDYKLYVQRHVSTTPPIDWDLIVEQSLPRPRDSGTGE